MAAITKTTNYSYPSEVIKSRFVNKNDGKTYHSEIILDINPKNIENTLIRKLLIYRFRPNNHRGKLEKFKIAEFSGGSWKQKVRPGYSFIYRVFTKKYHCDPVDEKTESADTD